MLKRPYSSAQQAFFKARALKKKLNRIKPLPPNSDFLLQHLQQAEDPSVRVVRCKDGKIRRYRKTQKNTNDEYFPEIRKPGATKLTIMKNGQTRRVPAHWKTRA